MSHETVLEYEFEDPGRARTVFESVRRELGEIEGDRTRASLDREGNTVVVTVIADDLTALRAGLTTWESLIRVAERTTCRART